jgi:hypothetical protein
MLFYFAQSRKRMKMMRVSKPPAVVIDTNLSNVLIPGSGAVEEIGLRFTQSWSLSSGSRQQR